MVCQPQHRSGRCRSSARRQQAYWRFPPGDAAWLSEISSIRIAAGELQRVAVRSRREIETQRSGPWRG